MSGRVIVLMGSKTDLAIAQEIGRELARYGLAPVYRIASAHKSPAYLLNMVREYEAQGGPRVYVAVAGRSNALSGMVDAAVSAPVISCPPYSDRYGGADLFSSLRMPSGVAPVTVLEPAAAALAAAKILALTDPVVHDAVVEFQKSQTQKIVSDDEEIRS